MLLNYNRQYQNARRLICPKVMEKARYRCAECGRTNHSKWIIPKPDEYLEYDNWLAEKAKAKKWPILQVKLTCVQINDNPWNYNINKWVPLCQHHFQLNLQRTRDDYLYNKSLLSQLFTPDQVAYKDSGLFIDYAYQQLDYHINSAVQYNASMQKYIFPSYDNTTTPDHVKKRRQHCELVELLRSIIKSLNYPLIPESHKSTANSMLCNYFLNDPRPPINQATV